MTTSQGQADTSDDVRVERHGAENIGSVVLHLDDEAGGQRGEFTHPFDFYFDSTGKPLTEIETLSNLVLFVGANNSGKSLFMRALASLRSFKVKFKDLDLLYMKDQFLNIKANLIRFADALGSGSISNTAHLMPKEAPEYLSLDWDTFRGFRESIKTIESDIRDGLASRVYRSATVATNIVEQVEIAQSLLNKIPIIPEKGSAAPLRFYIPVLRGLRRIQENKDVYRDQIVKEYFPGRDHLTVYTGQTFFERLLVLKTGTDAEQENIEAYEKFLSSTLFHGKRIKLTANTTDKVVTVKVGSEPSDPIHQVGDGIQQIIILTFLVYTTTQPALFFIEEPETHLHPSLQRLLLESFVANPQHMFFMTTHSNHLLDLSLDIKEMSIFTFRKRFDKSSTNRAQFEVTQVDSGDSSTLHLLGVRNSSVFLSNATVFVEGITDRFYIRAMLKSYMEHLQGGNQVRSWTEDIHYSFVEFAGSNITHWHLLGQYGDLSETERINIKRLCARCIVVIDRDDPIKKSDLHNALQKFLGDERLVILPCKEIENSLPRRALAGAVAATLKCPPSEIPPELFNNYENKPIGTYIDNVLKDLPLSVRKRKFEYKRTTIANKDDFCRHAINTDIKYEELTPKMQAEIRKIYDFISKQNQEMAE